MFNFNMGFGGMGGGGMGGGSNYPQNYNSFHPTSSGPPPPPGSGFSGYGAFGQAAQNSSYSSYGCYGGFAPQNLCGNPAVQQMHNSYPMGQQAPPPPPPMPMPNSYGMGAMAAQQEQFELQMQQRMYQQMGFRTPTAPVAMGGGGQQPQQEEAEQQEDDSSSKKDIDEQVKAQMKAVFMNELMRRYAVSSTFEVSQGTVVPMMKYPEDDIVVEFYRKERDEDLAGKDWDAEADCEYLREAMRGLGTNESIITTIVSTRCNAQRQRLKELFKTMYGRDLIEDIKSELSGDYKGAIVACFVSPAEFDARCIKRAIYGLGTDEAALIEILMTRTNAQTKEMRRVYGQVARPDEVTYETLVEKDIEDDTSGDFKRLLIATCQGNRYEITREKLEEAVEEIVNDAGEATGMFRVDYTKLCDVDKARRDAKRLYKAGEDRWGTDEETFTLLNSTRNYYHLRQMYQEYIKITQGNILNAIDGETSGSYKKGLAAIAMSVMNRPKFFAKGLIKSMKGLGTDEETLIRIIASRSEIDMVQIKQCFLEETNKTLYRWLEHDCSFNFKKILQALVGRD